MPHPTATGHITPQTIKGGTRTCSTCSNAHGKGTAVMDQTQDTPKYKEGDLVWLEGRNLCLSQPMPKLAPRHHRPFKVVQVMSPVNYCLELPTQWSIHSVFHIYLLTPYHKTITHGPNFQHPPPNLVDNKEEYKVEKILDSWQFGRHKQLQYLVKWKGYPDSDNMWVNKDDVFANDKVWDFKASNPDARMHIRHLWRDRIPQFSLAPSSSSSTSSYFTPAIMSMSNVSTPARCSTPGSVAGGLSRTFLHDKLLYKILLRLLRVGWGPPYWGDLPP